MNHSFIIIIIIIVRKNKIKREIKILQNLSNGPNVVKLLDVIKDSASKTTSLVIEIIFILS